MDVSEVLLDGFGRLPELVAGAVDGLDAEQLRWTPAVGTNPVGWLVWHLTRVQDHHVGDLLGEDQLWLGGDWAARFGLEPDPTNTGYGHDEARIAAVRPDGAGLLVDYYAAVAARTDAYLGTLTAADLDRVVDKRWSPPVTLGVRLVSILNDDVQHVGQAAYVRGIILRG